MISWILNIECDQWKERIITAFFLFIFLKFFFLFIYVWTNLNNIILTRNHFYKQLCFFPRFSLIYSLQRFRSKLLIINKNWSEHTAHIFNWRKKSPSELRMNLLESKIASDPYELKIYKQQYKIIAKNMLLLKCSRSHWERNICEWQTMSNGWVESFMNSWVVSIFWREDR